MIKTVILGIFVLSVLVVMYTTTDLALASPTMREESVSVNMETVFTLNAEPLDKTTILITGHAPRAAMEPVELTVTAPNGNMVTIDQASIDSNFNYMTEIKINPELWNVNGAYVITAHQGPGWLHNFVSTNVEVVDGLIANFKINYQVDYGYVTYIQNEPDSNSLIVSINTVVHDVGTEIFRGAPRDGTLTIELPREVIDAKIMNTHVDDKFVVLVDGEDTQYEETIASSMRTLTIPFPYGSNEIKIMGTSVDPTGFFTAVPKSGFFTVPEFVAPTVPEFEIVEPQDLQTTEATSKIPNWVKDTFKWYVEGAISEDELIGSIQFLIKEGIITI